MFRLKTLILCAILIQSLTAQWLERKNGLPDTWDFGGSVIEPVDSLIAFVTADDGQFYKTSDAGLNWYDITSPTFPTDLYVDNIAAISENSIWICGYNYTDRNTNIYASFDGGGSWVKQYQRDEGDINYIEMFSKDSGMAAGYSYGAGPVPMIQTYDGGAHWIEKNNEYLVDMYGLSDGIDIVDMDFIFFQEKWYRLFRSTDGGTSWDSIYTPSLGSVVNFYDRHFGLLATDGGRIHKSLDGGDTWNEISNLPYNTSRCIEFLPGNPAKIWWSLEWKLFFSEDSGKTWTEYPFDGDFWSYDIDFVDNRHGWILAEDMVYYTNTGDRIVTESENIPKIELDYTLAQNYPNPFNPSTQIKYSLPYSQYVKITIYNTLGQAIESLLSEEMPAGHHEIKFNAQNLSSGIYYYRIEAGKFQKVKKMIYTK